ncbi:hypothetical protein VNI00_004170 [Paramarasmius palmivorus]|uniref:Uncharacterized protein n=1 Tax=Paramarasmius palmivorus TaxID=297713 RepID=A0AAW0DK38_9AGAR
MSRLPPTFTSLYRLFLRTTSASVLHHTSATRNLRQLWKPVFSNAAQNIKKLEQDPSRQEIQQWLDKWEKRMNNTLKFLYNSATSRGLPHQVVRNLSLMVLAEYQHASAKLPVWNPRLAPDAPEYSTEVIMKAVTKRQQTKEFDKKAVNALDQVVKMAEGRDKILFGRMMVKAKVC